MPSNDMVESHGLKPEDFDSIREAVMETPRGRWFLNEYSARLRGGDTTGLIDSMKRLENAVAASHGELMTRLSQAMENPGPARAAPQAELAPRHMKFFSQDDEIFESAPQARIAAVPGSPKPEPKPETPRGAKVIIRRAGEASPAALSEADAVDRAEVFGPAPPPPAPSLEAPAPAASATPKRRIIITRHQPGDDVEVPLQNDIAQAS